ncbi:hypothetical protein PsYK624_035530 [Phanerochaete sordida]|uniref:F-box domain-containing protein n=1 Tax=Phanerochaete sordida TaxID=48140 RepID=A0A9P3G412_9APHY|nr:hypothetical protein PsYK624_035530 [Phanerochaete sordida]
MDACKGFFSYALPPELTLMIMRRMDKPSLEASARVSRVWLALAQPYLFESVAYKARRDEPQPLGDLLGFLHASPHVCPYVSQVALRLADEAPGLCVAGRRARCTLHTLAAALRCLPRLRTLTLYCFPLQCCPTHAEAPLGAPAVPRLAALHIPGWYSAPDGDCPLGVVHFLSLFGAIDRLVLGPSVAFPDSPVPPALAPASTPRVRALVLDSVAPLRGLSAALPLAGLERLTLPVLTRDSTAACRALLADVCGTLRHLELRVHIPAVAATSEELDFSFLRTLDVAAMPALAAVTVVLPVYGRADSGAAQHPARRDGPHGACVLAPAHAFLAALVPALPAGTHTLRLALHLFSRDPAYAFFRAEWWDWRSYPLTPAWAPLYDVLLARVARGLRHVEFADAVGTGLPDVEKQAIVSAMPQLWESGTARFV